LELQLSRHLSITLLAVLVALGTCGSNAHAQVPTAELAQRGADIFQSRCAGCHEKPLEHVPPKSAISALAPESVFRALTAGVMRQNAAGLSDDELKAVVVHLTGRLPGADTQAQLNANRCRGAAPSLALSPRDWNGWGGRGLTNARYQPEPGLQAADVPKLKLKWAFAYPGGPAGQPVVIGRWVFVTTGSGYAFALDAASGCTRWADDLGVPSNAAISIGRLPSGKVAAYFGDDKGEIRALDAYTGAELWRTRLDDHVATRLNGGTVLYGGRLYVPVSSLEEASAAKSTYRCCSFRGSLAALDAATGRLLWKSYTIEQAPQPVPDDPSHLAPAGAAVWTAPAIDVKRRLIYVGTGDAYTSPAVPESDAIIAFDLDTGARRWVRQLTPDDAWLVGCEPTPNSNCPKELGPDFDVGSPILVAAPSGGGMLIASSKAGLAWGLDLDQQGKILWETRVGQGGTRGGIEWGGSSDGNRVYFPISDAREGVLPSSKATANPAPTPGGMNALSVATGELLWHTPVPTTTCAWGTPCNGAQPGAPTLMPGVVFAGSWDGHERAYSTADGRILWDFDTGQSFDGVNGTKVTGGSIDRGSQTIADGALYVNSGVRMRTGNALLVFTVNGR
jgi:polyvinyl alcohol dehydrogenase (cytochrome)